MSHVHQWLYNTEVIKGVREKPHEGESRGWKKEKGEERHEHG